MTTRISLTLLLVAALSMALAGKLCNSLIQDLTAVGVFGIDMDFDDA